MISYLGFFFVGGSFYLYNGGLELSLLIFSKSITLLLWFASKSTSVNSSIENYLSRNKSITNGPPNPSHGVGPQMVSPKPIFLHHPPPPNPRLLLYMDLIYPAHNLLKTHGLLRSNSAYPKNPTLIKTFTRIESMIFISPNVRSKCAINRSKMN